MGLCGKAINIVTSLVSALSLQILNLFTKQKFKVSMPWVCITFGNVCIMDSTRFGLCIVWSTRRSIMASTTWKCPNWLPSGSESVKGEHQGSKNIHLTFSFEATRDTLTVSGTWPDNLCLCFDLLNAQNSLRTSDGKKWYTFRAVHFRYMHDHFLRVIGWNIPNKEITVAEDKGTGLWQMSNVSNFTWNIFRRFNVSLLT